MFRDTAYNMLDRVSEEMEAARFAIIQTIGAVDREATWARLAEQARVGRGELLRCRANLETTFLLRLFAEFEAILRDYWRQGLHRRKQPDVSVLIGRVAAYRRVPDKHPDHLGVDEVREYRNDLVHEQIRVARLTFEQCLSRIGRFLRWLPAEW